MLQTSEKTAILPEQELVVKKISFSLMYFTKPIIWSSILPFLLRSTWEREATFWFWNEAAILIAVCLCYYTQRSPSRWQTCWTFVGSGLYSRPSSLRDLDSCLPELTRAMLRRKPTRIELRGEDIEEYEKVKKLWAKDPKKDEEAAKAQSFLGNDDSPMPLNDPKRILRIHERIGYKPDTVPSDGTVTFLS